jgi:hypothetical protein
MMEKRIFILLPDGNGLRNFIFGNLGQIIKAQSNVTIWNNSPVPLRNFGFSEIKMAEYKAGKFTETLKAAKQNIELNLNSINNNDSDYLLYNLNYQPKGFKGVIKKLLFKGLSVALTSNSRRYIIDFLLEKSESSTAYFDDCYKLLKEENPSIVFCTNQRPLTCIAPILAAKKLKIPTATFIFSWDNIPKATMVINTDYYFVWSIFMKEDLLKHYPYVKENQVLVTGSPQFENHFNKEDLLTREQFYLTNGLDKNFKYICFSGNDITTSPNDAYYLKDVADSVRQLNAKGHKIKIIFRRCPVDFSNRFDEVINDFNDVIVNINTLTENYGVGWSAYVPNQKDIILQSNIIEHTELVVNVGSTMVFDFVCHNKPCLYINYNQPYTISNKKWKVEKCYKYKHFESMPNENCVVWINSKEEYNEKLLATINNPKPIVDNAKKWFEIVNGVNYTTSSVVIWNSIKKIILN